MVPLKLVARSWLPCLSQLLMLLGVLQGHLGLSLHHSGLCLRCCMATFPPCLSALQDVRLLSQGSTYQHCG